MYNNIRDHQHKTSIS